MKSFFSSIFSSCLGTLLAFTLMILILIGIGSGLMMNAGKQSVHISESSILKISIPDLLPEQTNNMTLQGLSLDQTEIIGLHDLANAIRHAAEDPKIKGLYIDGSMYNHGYASLNVIREALQKVKASGKFIVAYAQYLDHKNYYIASLADPVILHPIGFLDLKGFGLSIPHFKEFADKIGLDFNIYYAGEFKSATEPFRFNKMSPQNRLQLKAFLDEQYARYIQEVSQARKLDASILKDNFDGFRSYSPDLAVSNRLVDMTGYEADAYQHMRTKLGLGESDKLPFVSLKDYFHHAHAARKDFSSSSRIAVLYAEGNIVDDKGHEGEIGRKYLKTLREIRTTKSIKALVLRVNSPGGSALLSDEMLKEIDLIREQGKPVVVSMGDYAASGGYYISCHADSIFANPYTLTGSIGVFALIPDLSVLTGDKIGIDMDTVGTGPMANTFNIMLPWGPAESRIMQENVDRIYQQFISVIAKGRNLPRENVMEIAKGRIWGGQKAMELGLINSLGSLEDAISCAARMASTDQYRVSEFPTQTDPFQKMLEALQGNHSDEGSLFLQQSLKHELGPIYPYYRELNYYRNHTGLQMRLPFLVAK
ncbi:MAG TPA: signal peptide peptidase SppA [Saprospiraceae bacterium]|nr:signal peptide peptidase SppA [Saprospiraceae bacterium]